MGQLLFTIQLLQPHRPTPVGTIQNMFTKSVFPVVGWRRPFTRGLLVLNTRPLFVSA
jgi:hypothetical protein